MVVAVRQRGLRGDERFDRAVIADDRISGGDTGERHGAEEDAGEECLGAHDWWTAFCSSHSVTNCVGWESENDSGVAEHLERRAAVAGAGEDDGDDVALVALEVDCQGRIRREPRD